MVKNMTNRRYLESLDDRAFAEWMSNLSDGKIPLKEFCKGFCNYSDETGKCTKLCDDGDIDCTLSITDMIFYWLKAEQKN